MVSTACGMGKGKLLKGVVIVFACLLNISASSGADYTYIELLPPGWQWAQAVAINNSGLVVGYGSESPTYSGVKSFIYTPGAPGTYTEIPPPPDCEVCDSIQAVAITDDGVVAGNVSAGAPGFSASIGFVYRDGLYAPVGPPPGWSTVALNLISNNGAIAGLGFKGDPTGPQPAWYFQDGSYREILPPGSRTPNLRGINGNGVVVGFASSTTTKGFIFNPGNPDTYVELLPPGWTAAEAKAINNSGAVAGDGVKGFLYTPGSGSYREIAPPGWTTLQVRGINNLGAVLGYGYSGTVKAFVYDRGRYTSIIPPGVQQAYPTGINDDGMVVGWTFTPNVLNRGFLAIPPAQLSLEQGWNFISLPKVPPDTLVENALSSIFLKVRAIWGYDNQAQKWQKYMRGATPNTLSRLHIGSGYWVYMDSPGDLDISGWTNPPPTAVHLYEGWNLVGYTGTNGVAPPWSLRNFADKWDLVWGWDAGEWSAQHATLTTLPVQELTSLSRGKAYWIRIRQGLVADWAQ
jgi:hypothetical protein